MKNTLKRGTRIGGKQVKRRLGALALLMLGLANMQLAHAEIVTRTREKTTSLIQQTVINPCVPADGDILIDTILNTVFTSRQDGNNFRSRFTINEQGFGKSIFTNVLYEYKALSDNRFESDVNTFVTSFESRQLIDRKGPAPWGIPKTDFFLRTRIRTKVIAGDLGDQTIEAQRSESGCHNDRSDN